MRNIAGVGGKPREGHVATCRCRTTDDGKQVADMRCLTPAQRNAILALIRAQEAAEKR